MRGNDRNAHQSRERGYILLPVVLLITLVSVVAFLLNNESVLDAGITESVAESAEAQYVAQAGLQHAIREIRNSGCRGNLTLASTPLGAHSYQAAVTSAATTTAYTINVDQDTWLKESSPTQNNGSDSELYVKDDNSDMRAMYRFNLSAIPAGAQIGSAVAWFYVTQGDEDGAVSIHEVTAAWTEATATWAAMASQFDSVVIDSIPAQDDNGVWVKVNLGSLVQSWVNGNPNNGIMLLASSDGEESRYNSREGPASKRPRLEVVATSSPATPVTISATGTLANGVTRTLNRINVPAFQLPSSRILQPGAEGEDAEIWDQAPNNNYGDADETWVSSATNDTTRSLLRFNMDAIPAGAKILGATLSLERRSGSGADQPVSAHRITNPWSEASVTWNRRETGTNWDTAGGDFDNLAVATTPVGPGNQRYAWNITPLVQGWVDGSYPNYGVALVAAIAGMPGERFYTSDESQLDRRPSLSVTYTCECGIACIAPQGSGRVAMVGDWIGPAPDPMDLEKEAIIESWGYDVDIYDDDFVWWIDPSFYDVVYVSETAASAAVGTQLTNFTIGVINEQGNLNDELEIAAGKATSVGSDIDVTDNSHYITVPFAQGLLPIYSAEMEMLMVSGTEAPGLQTLAEFSSTGSLVVLDAGMPDTGGGTAAGRRVTLPLGRATNSNFNWNYLNNNGRFIVQRAIQWGTGNTAGAGAPQLLFVVEDAGNLTAQESAKQALFDTWGYAVTVIGESDSQANYDAAVALSDVVFIGEDVASGAIGTKLVNAPIGVVTEEDNLSDEFGLSAGINWETGTQVEINDNTHYITSPFATGLLTIMTSTESMSYVTGAQSPDLGRLASTASGFAVVTLEAGAATHTGGFAAGRRVQLPWGNNDFDFNHLNIDGRTLLQRALEWGAGASLVTPKTIMFVVPDATALTAQDAAKKVLMEAWGFSVVPITAADSQANFDAAAASADVAYISEEVTSSNVGTKLRDATIGVVSEETALTDEFGIAGVRTGYTGTDIEVVDTAHYITSVFASGPLAIASAATGLNRLTGSLAPDLDSLAETTGNPELATIELGGLLYDGGTAAGRRVQLPWGADAFDINLLTADGQTLMRRAIEWGSSAGTLAGPVAHWKLDETSGTTAVDSAGGNDGTLTNGPVWTPGKIDGGLEFDGVDDRVSVGTFDVSGSGLTLMGWFNADTITTTDPRIISKASSSAANDAWWQLSTVSPGSNRYLRMRIKAGGTTTTFADSSVNLSPGQWYFAVGTYHAASGQMKLYLDGAEIASGTHAVGGPVDTDPTVPVAIGANGNAERFFDGILDDVRVYDRVLSDTEISDLFAAGGGGGGGGGGGSGNFRDEFTASSFGNNDGSLNWAGDWIEVDDNGAGPGSGNAQISGGVLNLDDNPNTNGEPSLAREADLSAYTSATLTYSYFTVGTIESSDSVTVEISDDGGSSWTTLQTYSDDVSGSASFDISAYISSNTQIRFRVTENYGGSGEQFHVDDLDIAVSGP